MIMDLGCLLIKPITHIVNISFSQGIFPKHWKPAVVVPIFKSADPHSVSNYRPISILPVMSKVIEKLVAEQLISHLNSSQLLHPMQHGFRAHHSTETATVYFVERVKTLMDKGGVVGAIFLDLRKAFDTVNHSILQSKFGQFNFSLCTSSWFNSYLSHRTQCVKIENVISNFNNLTTGVPQGSVLGPILFSLYINDLPSVCQGCDVVMYADDTVIFVKGKTHAEAAAQLTKIMVNISAWLNACCLQLNTSKTVTMFFAKNNKSYIEPDVFISGKRVQIVHEYKYLGILIDCNLTFKGHVKKVCKNLKFTLSNFRHLRNHMSTEAAKMYMFSLILSHINYCLTTWSTANSTTLKPVISLYKQALKILDKKPRTFHHCTILNKYRFLSWDNLIIFKNCCLMYKIRHSLAPPPLCSLISFRSSLTNVTRGASRGDCEIPFRKSLFGQSTFSYRTAHEWNSTPQNIRDCSSYNSFKRNIKNWLMDNQHCEH